ncbi:MAG: hypothetical protein ACRBEQ_10025 [Hyphomonas sp.]
MMVAETIDRLVELHGEAGVCPTREEWRAIFEVSSDGPIQILNLLKFEPQVTTLDGQITGQEAYGLYSQGVGPAFMGVGAKRLHAAQVGMAFGLGATRDWDFMIMTQYPSAKALAEMWLDDRFIAAHKAREDGVAASEVLVMAAR